MNETGRLLVISERGIGDGLTLLPALEALRRLHPEIAIDLLAPGLEALRRNLADTAVVLDSRALAAGRAGRRDWLDAAGYRWVWNTENEASSWRPVLTGADNPAWLSAPPHRSWPKKPVVGLRLAQLRQLFPGLGEAGPPVLRLTAEQDAARQAFRAQLPAGKRIVAVQPGGNDPNKVWAGTAFRAVIDQLVRSGTIFVVLLLGPADWPEMDEASGGPGVLVARDSLDQAVARLAACDLLLGNDSGFYHLAHSLGLCVVGIYRTRGSMLRWSYASDRSRALSFYLPGFLRRHWRRFITPKQVVRQVEALLDG